MQRALGRGLALLFLVVSWPLVAVSLSNPFELSFPVKQELDFADYKELQKRMRAIRLEPFMVQLPSHPRYNLSNFWCRLHGGIHLTLIDEEKGFFPEVGLEKIGQGGPRCIVCYASFNRIYPQMLRSLLQRLRQVGFNGYFYYRIGGYPNPTGEEARYAATPYAFKLFMMLEGRNLGFDKVLWIDSSFLPLRNPEPLFDWIEEHGHIFRGWSVTKQEQIDNIFPCARETLQEVLGVDVCSGYYVPAGCFGLKFGTAEADQFVRSYYQLARLGIPFMSEVPEEFVLSGLLSSVYRASWKPADFQILFVGHPAEAHKTDSFFLFRDH